MVYSNEITDFRKTQISSTQSCKTQQDFLSCKHQQAGSPPFFSQVSLLFVACKIVHKDYICGKTQRSLKFSHSV